VKEITIIGKTDWRNSNQIFGIKDSDRLNHIYAIGKTGTGKSTLLMNMAISDIERGNGLCIIDPHGDVAETVLNYVPKERINDVIYFNAADTEFPTAFNPLNSFYSHDHHLVVSNLISTLKKIWADSWGPRLEHILRFCLLSLLHYPKATLLDIQPMLTDTYFRNGVLNYVADQAILNFWRNEFDKDSPQFKSEAIAPILNKTGLFIASEPLRNIVGQESSSFSIREVMDGKKILICNLSKGIIGEDASALLGSMMVTAIQSTALSRASYDLTMRTPFYFYIDEVHSFTTLSFIDVLSEARKFGLSLFLTHQYIEQLEESMLPAIFGNIGTLISFRIGAEDAKQLAREFYPIFSESDLIRLPRYSMYLKLMIDGVSSKPFSAIALSLKKAINSYKDIILENSRKKYGSNIATVRNSIESRFANQGSNHSSIQLFG